RTGSKETSTARGPASTPRRWGRRWSFGREAIRRPVRGAGLDHFHAGQGGGDGPLLPGGTAAGRGVGALVSDRTAAEATAGDAAAGGVDAGAHRDTGLAVLRELRGGGGSRGVHRPAPRRWDAGRASR